MSMKTVSSAFVLAAACLIGSAQAQDAKSDKPAPQASTPHPAVCTFSKAVVCKDGGKCEPATALGDLPLPARFLVHFEKRIIAATTKDGLPHISSIRALAHAGDTLILQGVNGAVGWSIQSAMSSGTTTFVTASNHSVLTAFGTCKSMD